jgi:hypothetical protein
LRFFIPLADWDYEKQIGAIGKVRDVRHPIGAVMTQRSQLLLIPMWAYDHDMRTHMKLAGRGREQNQNCVAMDVQEIGLFFILCHPR